LSQVKFSISNAADFFQSEPELLYFSLVVIGLLSVDLLICTLSKCCWRIRERKIKSVTVETLRLCSKLKLALAGSKRQWEDALTIVAIQHGFRSHVPRPVHANFNVFLDLCVIYIISTHWGHSLAKL
jgi:hypothetical protein